MPEDSVKEVLSELSFSFFLSSFLCTMVDKYIQHLLNPSHITSPDIMLFYYTQSIIYSQDSVPEAMERVIVESSTVSKDPHPPQHEFIIFNVRDSKKVFSNRKIINKRTVGDMEPKPLNKGEASESNNEELTDVLDVFLFKTFFEHPKSKQFLWVIQQNIPDSPSTSTAVTAITLVASFALL